MPAGRFASSPRPAGRPRGALSWRVLRWLTRLRFAGAALLVAVAVVVASGDGSGSDLSGHVRVAAATVVVADRDLTSGAVLAERDLRLVRVPVAGVPEGAIRSVPEVVGRTVAAPLRRGSTLTDVALLGRERTELLGAPGSVAVPVEIAAVSARFLVAGDRVDAVIAGDDQSASAVVADLVVLAIAGGHAGDVAGGSTTVMLAAPPQRAASLAVAALNHPVVVTLRGRGSNWSGGRSDGGSGKC